MNPLIEKQLKLVEVAQLPPYINGNIINIPKHQNEKITELQIGHFYLIKVEDYIIKPFEGFTLHDNWNKGIPPKHKYMSVEVLKIMGKMIRINSIGYDFENKVTIQDDWEGWLPKSSIEIIKEI